MYGALLALFAFQFLQIYRVNKDMLNDPDSVPEMHRYKFKQVAILDINYFVTFDPNWRWCRCCPSSSSILSDSIR